MRRYFATEGSDLLVYDDETEHWSFKGQHEGTMSRAAARAVMWGLRRDELDAGDASELAPRKAGEP